MKHTSKLVVLTYARRALLVTLALALIAYASVAIALPLRAATLAPAPELETAAPNNPNPTPQLPPSGTAADVPGPTIASPLPAISARKFLLAATPSPEGQPTVSSSEALNYFSEIGFGVEYGSAAPAVHKWTGDARIKVSGSPTAADAQTLNQVVTELNGLVSGIKLSVAGPDANDANIEMHFLPESEFAAVEPEYVPVNLGFFRVWWDAHGVIYRARILISSEGVTQQERSHLIREELTQSLGLFKDSWQYPESIFYQGWTATGQYAPIDRSIIRLLYQPRLLPGMNNAQARELLAAD